MKKDYLRKLLEYVEKVFKIEDETMWPKDRNFYKDQIQRENRRDSNRVRGPKPN